MSRLDGRRVVVTGAGRGLGAAIAQHLGEAGASVVIAEVNAATGADTAAGLRDQGIDATFVPMDVRDPESVRAAVAAVAESGPIHGLVNNAARADAVGGKLVHELTVEEWDEIMTVNVRGVWLVCAAVIPHLVDAGTGRIVNLASDAALYGSPRLSHYVTSKGAVIALTRAMSRELGIHGITVNAVAPGLTVGESTSRVPEERHELYRRGRAIPRDQQPDDVTGAVAFLLADEAAYITGQLLVVDGGFVCH